MTSIFYGSPTYIVVILLAVLTSTKSIANETDQHSIIVTAMWESMYVSEGRDNTGSSGLYAVESVYETPHLALGLWVAESDDTSYNEINVSLEYSREIYGADVYIGYTYLDFPDDEATDNEFSSGISVPLQSWLAGSLDYVYSDEAEGSFLELSLHTDIPLTNKRCSLNPFITQSFDFGFASPEHDGVNSFQVGVNFFYKISNNIELSAYLIHSWAQEDVKRGGEGDLIWGGVSVTVIPCCGLPKV